MAAETGRETLRNGAVLVWDVADEPDSRLGLAVPAFAQWGPQGFTEPIEIRMSASALASVDAWQIAFHRKGDTRFERPLRTFRGTALSLADPLMWDGKVDSGPPLRPGETVLAVLSVRDTAGNIDSAAPQEVLIARYIMKRERRRIRALDANRKAAVARGALPERTTIPERGRSVTLRIDGWSEEDDPLISGLPLRREGSSWVLHQTMLGGSYDLVVQVARPIIGGFRAIPVGIVRLNVPFGEPLLARVKGTGALDRFDRSSAIPRGLRGDGAIAGSDAARLVLLDREVGEDRLAIALVDPAQTVDLAKDNRKRRSLVLVADPSTVLWAGKGAPPSPTRPPDEPSTRTVSARFSAPFGGEIVLPHTDIIRGSLQIDPENDTAPFASVRDFFLNPAQGRILLTENALTRLSQEQIGVIRVKYKVHSFAPRMTNPDMIVDNGEVHRTTWGRTVHQRYGIEAPKGKEQGLIGKLLDWFSGSK